MNLLRGSIGLVALLAICFAFSNNRKRIDWKLVAVGVSLQLIFAFGILKIGFIRNIFSFLSKCFVKLIDTAYLGFGNSVGGGKFLFGNLSDASQNWGYVFAIQVLPGIIFFAALSSLMYYLGILQKIVYGFAWVLSKTMKQISGAESLSTAANIFLGQTEAPLMVRPYLAGMTKSEMLCVMIGGMANTAGSVLAAYIGFLGGTDPALRNYYAMHMLSQSIMSAPAALVISKIMFPQTETENLNKNLEINKETIGTNALDAIANGTTDGLKLAVNVGAMLIVFTALMAVLNYILFKIGGWTHLNDVILSATSGRFTGLSFQLVLSYVFAPLAWLIGVTSADTLAIGQLLGEKTVVNEFVAYISLGQMQKDNIFTDPKSLLIATYALCGFANFASIGIQIGGIGALAPSQRKNLSELGIKSLIGGTIACLMTATIAGMLY
jgi:CNT family concentrative nucleoside transporter